MRLNVVVLVIVLAVLVVFAGFNLNGLLFPHTVYLGTASASLPLGLLLLVFAAIVALLFYMLAAYADLRARADSARTLREMEALRVSLDQQEGSRFAQLQGYLQERFAALESNVGGDLASQLSARVDRVRDELAADIGQLDDLLRRRLEGAPERPL